MSAADGRVLLAHLLMTASVAAEKVLRKPSRIEDTVARVLKLAAQHRQIDVEQAPLPLAHLAGDNHGLDVGAIINDTTAPGTWLTGATLIRVASRIMI
jgi:hypothetical protein